MSEPKLLGKEGAIDSVSAAVKSGRLSHALVLSGAKGIGKSLFADYVCKLLFCGEQINLCADSPACLKVDKGIHPDVFKIYPAGKSETIGVKEISVIKNNLYIKPNDADKKIFIIYSAERMNRFAQNSILKMIEEPPEDSFFILTCQNSQALLPTVRSRVTEISLAPASLKETQAELLKRMPELSDSAAERAARLSGGNIGMALEIAEGGELSELYDCIDSIANAIVDKDRALLCLALGKFSKKKEAALKLAELLMLTFRDVLAYLAGAESRLGGSSEGVKTLCKYLSVNMALQAIDECQKFISAVNGNANLALQLCSLEIRLGEIARR